MCFVNKRKIIFKKKKISAPLIMKYQVQRFGITAATATGWGQEEGMDEDTTTWKEDVRPLMEAQKGTNNILFERLFSGQ